MRQVISFVNENLNKGRATALVTLMESGEHTPGVTGGMMAVLEDGSFCGTVGGGKIEADIIAKCREALKDKNNTGFQFRYSLTADGELGMVCGGQVSGFVNILRPGKKLFIFGGGHVGRKIYEVAKLCDFNITVIEDREDYAEYFPQDNILICQNFAQAARELAVDENSYAVIVTRGHASDYDILRVLVEKPLAYLGMIGSKNKVALTFQRLRKEGVSQEDIDKIYAPVGLAIDDGSPGEIAIAIMAEILQVKNNGALQHCKDKLQK